ncbi:MAG: tetratricopeptide repeat protein [Planctomycetes bacterium]|nr:tetratricopeptide repeat protein [Planctomycetota bacterium]
MARQAIPPKVIIFVIAAFLAVVVVNVWRGEDRGDAGRKAAREASRIELSDKRKQLDVHMERSPDELKSLISSRINLLRNGKTDEQQAVAIQLACMTNDPTQGERLLLLGEQVRSELRQTLLAALGSPDAVVSQSCQDALVGLWRSSDSMAATQRFQEGLKAYQTGDPDRALEIFRAAQQLRATVPPDLYRMKAQILLKQSRLDEALEECRRALDAEPANFFALFVVARIHAEKGNQEKALKALDAALKLNPAFTRARALQEELLGGA